MAILKLESNNKDISYVINKNPNSGMIIRDIRKGKAFGWFPKEDHQTYLIYFKEGEGEISYKRDENDNFDYLTLSGYNSPIFVLNAISEFFGRTLKRHNDHDIQGRHRITIPFIEINRFNRIETLTKHFDGVKITYNNVVHNNYEVTIEHTGNVRGLLHNTLIWASLISEFSEIYFDKSTSLVKKLVTSLNEINAHYYLRNVFMNGLTVSKKMFNTIKKELENNSHYEINLTYGHTGEVRRNFVTEQLAFDKPILDIGCGEGYYTFPYAKRLDGEHGVYAVDIDPEVREKLEGRVKGRQVENVEVFESLDKFIDSDNEGNADVLLVEVLEHMSVEDAKALLQQVLNSVDYDKVIITTPNKEFNKHYLMDKNEMRHDDHCWEMDSKDFQKFIRDTVEDFRVNIEFYNIGDTVDGISYTQGVVLERKGDE